ncbi:NAD(P)/FAD-dependent oxidoreductase [Jatrophihabitans sp.]|uniref:NAD(P)/FAD-dependent oxidoreductase n=1 Tax=Jatrophihabitans sp. TaxID=1932789 RepID=UPI002C79C545|nr:NAD(P)/FAD-dependent oxidoreductase [Jatrophihabitans sp.]
MSASPDADVVIVGAGLAGLSAALELTGLGRRVLLLEAASRPGGRVVTDLVDGFRLDRGFQLINPAYPRLRRLTTLGVLDPDRLRLQQFDAGVRVALDGRHRVLADPRRSPRDLGSTLLALGTPGLGMSGPGKSGLGTPVEQARFARWALGCLVRRPATLLARPDQPYGRQLEQAGIRGPLRTAVLEPFLAGVLGEDRAETSARYVALLIRTFLRGTPGVPAWGMQALPEQLAAALPAGTLRLGVPVESVTGPVVGTAGGRVTGRAVLVAADPAGAAALTGLPRPQLRSLTTFWFAAERSPHPRPILHLDGLRRGPVVNAAVLSAAAPAYSPDGRALVAASMVGLPAADTERLVRDQLGLMYATSAADWQLLRVDAIAGALPAMLPPLAVRQPVQLTDTLFVAGDHRDTASQQGALASGARAARAIHRQLG